MSGTGIRPTLLVIFGGFLAVLWLGIAAIFPTTSRAATQDGAVDPNFVNNPSFTGVVKAIATQNDGKFIISGFFTSSNQLNQNIVQRLNKDGSVDNTFAVGVTANNRVEAIAIQPDGKIIVGGWFSNYNGVNRNGVVRLNSDGSVDSSFNPGLGAEMVNALEIQPDGKILIAGWFTSYNGIERNRVTRLNSDGSLDNSFNPGAGAPDTIYTLKSQPDGKILIGGEFLTYANVSRSKIARLNSDGSLDISFNPGTGANNEVEVIELQPDGKILIGGFFTSYNSVERRKIARLNSDGSLDTAFAVNIAQDFLFATVYAIKVQVDGRIYLGGNIKVNGVTQNHLVRVFASGDPDFTFNSGAGPNGYVRALALENDGNVLVGGSFTAIDGFARNRIARLWASNKTAAAVSLTSSSNPANLGAAVIFTATLTPLTATGTVTFFHSPEISTQVPVINGQAVYSTTTLPAGINQIKAVYSGDNVFVANSTTYEQLIVPSCLVVTSLTDDGQGTTCGTFSAALTKAAAGLTITFALSGGNQINFSGSGGLAMPVLKAGASIDGGANGVILNGNGVAGDGLYLGGNNKLTNLTIRGFAGRELMVQGKNNHLSRVRVEP